MMQADAINGLSHGFIYPFTFDGYPCLARLTSAQQNL
jgi:hypothetical protein